MIIIGVDFHPEFQQIASLDNDTGEIQEKRLAHREETEKFYRSLAGQKVRVGMEASGHARWPPFPHVRLLPALRDRDKTFPLLPGALDVALAVPQSRYLPMRFVGTPGGSHNL